MQDYDYFVAHKFKKQEKDDLRDAIESAFKGQRLIAYYADMEIRESGIHILDKIVERIRGAQFGIFDITDGNPNVCLELGIAKGLERPFYIICHGNSIDNIPTDLKGLDRIDYGSYKELTYNIKEKILPKVLEMPKTIGIPRESLTEETKRIESYNIKMHISNLKNMLRLWQQNLSSNKVAPAEETGTFYALDSYASSSIRDIENHTLFKDIFHHFPSLKDFCNNFKTLSATYSLKRQALSDKIEGYIKQKLNDRNSDLKSEIGKGFVLSVYSEIVCRAKGKSKYDYFIERVSIKDVVKSRLIYGTVGAGYGYILEEIEPERIDEVKNIHKEMIKECEELYRNDIKELIETESKTKQSSSELNSKVSEIIYLMVFPHMDCKFVV